MASVQLRNVTKPGVTWCGIEISISISTRGIRRVCRAIGPANLPCAYDCQVETITSGDLFIGDTRMSRSHRQGGVGMVFQSYALYPHLSVCGKHRLA